MASARVLILSPVSLYLLIFPIVLITYGATLAAEFTAFFTYGLLSSALSALFLIIFPTSVATFGITSVIPFGDFLSSLTYVDFFVTTGVSIFLIGTGLIFTGTATTCFLAT
jgi:hypothetical protein